MSLNISLDQVRLASPCPAKWDEMDGDDRTRFCHQCQKNVYDLTQMNRHEFVDLVTRTEGKFCGRIYQRADERVLTGDCPIGLARVRRRMRKVVARCAAAILIVLGFFGYSLANSLTDPTARSALYSDQFLRALEEWANGPRFTLGSMLIPSD